jgi:large subunit ribosomal protein L30
MAQITAPKKSDSAVKLLAIRLRGEVGVRKGIEDTMQMLGLKRRYSGVLLDQNENTMGMVRKIESFIAWGEVSTDTIAALKERAKAKGFGLKPPVGGLRAIKLVWPKGDLGYRGDKINELAKRMI